MCAPCAECVHRVPSVLFFIRRCAKCASSRMAGSRRARRVGVSGHREVSQRTACTPYHFAGISTHVRRWRGRPNGERKGETLLTLKARALLAVVNTRTLLTPRATMAMPWVTAERPQRWEACYRWFKESWTSAVVGDALRYAPVHYAELCPLEREPYLQPAPGRPPRNEGTAAAASVLGRLAGRTVLFNGDSISVQHWMATACALLPGATDHSRMTVGSVAAADRKRQSSVGSVAAADSKRQSSGRPATPKAMCVWSASSEPCGCATHAWSRPSSESRSTA